MTTAEISLKEHLHTLVQGIDRRIDQLREESQADNQKVVEELEKIRLDLKRVVTWPQVTAFIITCSAAAGLVALLADHL